jgi:agmatinase
MSSVVRFDPGAPAVGGGIYGLPHRPEEAGVVLLPVPWEPTTSYGRGAARGPSAILEASAQVELFDPELGRPYEAGIAMLHIDHEIARWNGEACEAAEPIIARGGAVAGSPELEERLARVNELSAALNERVEREAAAWLAQGKLVGVIGGDHAAPFGAIKAHAARYPGMGILHIDAHADLRAAYEGFLDSHASIMRNVAERLSGVGKIVQVGLRDVSEEEHAYIAGSGGRIRAYFDAEIADRMFDGEPFGKIAEAIISDLPEDVYVTFDIDGLDPSLCPHTGTPVPGGLSFRQATAILTRLARSGRRIVGFDLNEVAPGPDGDEWDGNVGARVLYKLIGSALLSQRSR